MTCTTNSERNAKVDYDIISKINTYGLASLYIAKHKYNGKYVVAKAYNIDRLNSKDLELLKREVITNRKIKHPNIQNIIQSLTIGKCLYMFMPLMHFGSCKDVIGNFFNLGFPETFLAVIIRNILHGIIYLHRQGIIHRSICASHVLLNSKNAVLSGLRYGVSNVSHGKCITKLHHLENVNNKCLNWLAPELLEQSLSGYNELSDIYSLGITCCELANGVEPFADAQPTFMLTEKLRGNVPILLDRSTCPDHEIIIYSKQIPRLTSRNNYSSRIFTDDFHQFTEICMKKRPSERWTALQLLSHSFFKQCRNTNISKEVTFYGLDKSTPIEKLEITADDEIKSQTADFTWSF